MTLDEAIETIRYRCEQRTAHLGTVKVADFDHGGAVRVGMSLFPHGDDGRTFRHAVWGSSEQATSDPILFADACCDRLIEFFQRRAAADSASGG